MPECNECGGSGALYTDCAMQPCTCVGFVPRYRVGDEVESEVCTLAELLEANEDTFSDDDISALRALPIGESIEYGGGAAALFTITRVAP